MDWLKVSIDGPAGAGKSTVTKKVAQLFNLYYLDTGATYRATALYLKKQGISLNNATTLNEITKLNLLKNKSQIPNSKSESISKHQLTTPESQISPSYFPAPASHLSNLLKDIDIYFQQEFKNGQLQIRTFLNGEDVSEEIRTDEISQLASSFSAKEEVRKILVALQRRIAEEIKTISHRNESKSEGGGLHQILPEGSSFKKDETTKRFNGVIAEGRDIGTVVFPDADVKIFLTASLEERARRRHKELLARGENKSYEEVLKSIIERDHRDSTRKHSPLRQAEDAILIDTDGKTIQQVVDEIANLINRKTNS